MSAIDLIEKIRQIVGGSINSQQDASQALTKIQVLLQDRKDLANKLPNLTDFDAILDEISPVISDVALLHLSQENDHNFTIKYDLDAGSPFLVDSPHAPSNSLFMPSATIHKSNAKLRDHQFGLNFEKYEQFICLIIASRCLLNQVSKKSNTLDTKREQLQSKDIDDDDIMDAFSKGIGKKDKQDKQDSKEEDKSETDFIKDKSSTLDMFLTNLMKYSNLASDSVSNAANEDKKEKEKEKEEEKGKDGKVVIRNELKQLVNDMWSMLHPILFCDFDLENEESKNVTVTPMTTDRGIDSGSSGNGGNSSGKSGRSKEETLTRKQFWILRFAMLLFSNNHETMMRLSFIQAYLKENSKGNNKAPTKELIKMKARIDNELKPIILRIGCFTDIHDTILDIYSNQSAAARKFIIYFHEFDKDLFSNLNGSSSKGKGTDEKSDKDMTHFLLKMHDPFKGKTLLHIAGERSDLNLVKLLTKYGASYNLVKDYDNQTPWNTGAACVKEYFNSLYHIDNSNLSNKQGKQKIEEAVQSVQQQTQTINTFFQYLGVVSPKQWQKNEKNKDKDKEKQNDSDEKEVEKKEDLKEKELAHSTLKLLLETVQKILKDKMPVSQDLLMISWKYCQMLDRNNNNSNGGKSSHVAMYKEVLNGTIREALNHENAAKVRDYYWFKEYILNSNIWFELDEAAMAEQERNMTEEERTMAALVPFGQKKITMFEGINDTVDNELMETKKYIAGQWKHQTNFKAILEYPSYLVCNPNESLRQDHVCFSFVLFCFVSFCFSFGCCLQLLSGHDFIVICFLWKLGAVVSVFVFIFCFHFVFIL